MISVLTVLLFTNNKEVVVRKVFVQKTFSGELRMAPLCHVTLICQITPVLATSLPSVVNKHFPALTSSRNMSRVENLFYR